MNQRIRELLADDRGFGMMDVIPIQILVVGVVMLTITWSGMLVQTSAQTLHADEARAAIQQEAVVLLEQANTSGFGSVKVTGVAVEMPGLQENVTLTKWQIDPATDAIDATFTARTLSPIHTRTETAQVVMTVSGVAQYAGASGSRQAWTTATSGSPSIAYRVISPTDIEGDN
ncbi:hypothetical protein GCM10022288_15890 [Gryllotalpicola kribbensis]|uniref:Type II secretion system protein n=1 Tax=Gryllotalpicola kribbensis TaxID=993084 RepID=A0ABP8ARZ1_9MICO